MNHQFARRLSYFTVGYNVIEGLTSIALATLSGSSALLGFGIDSFVESLSGMIMIWRFAAKSHHDKENNKRERQAILLVGVSMLVLAGYVIYESASSLYFREIPNRSFAGLLIAVLSLVIMPILYVLKRRTATSIQSHSLAADARQTLACIMLSVALLFGTGLHVLTGIWIADPIAGLIIAAFLIREGYEAIIHKELCC